MVWCLCEAGTLMLYFFSVIHLGLQSVLHQEVLHAVCEQALGPVPSSDPGRVGQEEGQIQSWRLVMLVQTHVRCRAQTSKLLLP